MQSTYTKASTRTTYGGYNERQRRHSNKQLWSLIASPTSPLNCMASSSMQSIGMQQKSWHNHIDGIRSIGTAGRSKKEGWKIHFVAWQSGPHSFQSMYQMEVIIWSCAECLLLPYFVADHVEASSITSGHNLVQVVHRPCEYLSRLGHSVRGTSVPHCIQSCYDQLLLTQRVFELGNTVARWMNTADRQTMRNKVLVCARRV